MGLAAGAAVASRGGPLDLGIEGAGGEGEGGGDCGGGGADPSISSSTDISAIALPVESEDAAGALSGRADLEGGRPQVVRSKSPAKRKSGLGKRIGTPTAFA
jgi:hypothetical protein